jgi:heat shock protein HslJ
MKKIATIFALILGTAAIFTACASNNAENLEGNWIVQSLKSENQEINVVPANLELRKNGNNYSYSGNTGVNQIFGDVKIKNGKFSMKNGGMTKMMGAPEEVNFEDNFIACLNSAKTYSLDGDLLTISSRKSTVTLKKE